MRNEVRESGCGAKAARTAVIEWLAIALLFAASGAWPVPDVNETVYLTKARHAADPTWAAGDFFLETPDAHGVFYLLVGPVAAACSLEQTAWMGRMAGWLLLAIGFRHAVGPLLTSAGWRVAAAAMFALALRTTTAAGEWVIGGCEAKVFAWAFVLGGLGEIASGREARAFALGGIATALHPIVGGWACVATAATWLMERTKNRSQGVVRWGDTACLAIGLGAAAAGVIPALGLASGADAATRAEGIRIYVVDRLSHHLLPRTFADGMMARHVLAVGVWWLLLGWLPPSPQRRRVTTFTIVALGVSLAGIVIAAIEPWAPTAVYGLLRYYWFRLADVAVPFALATTAATALADDAICRRVSGVQPRLVRGLAMAIVALDLIGQSSHWPTHGGSPPWPRSDGKVAAAGWADICEWIRDHTPADACFLTPRGAASLTWRTGRREVVCWKNSPQDPASLVAWRQRILDCFSPTGSLAEMERSTASLGSHRLIEVADRYGADHIVVPIDAPLVEAMPGERLHANGAYAVYRLREPPTARPVSRPSVE